MLAWIKDTSARILHQSNRSEAAEWIAEATSLHPNTPDLITLTRRHFHLLFVYGTQMRGHPEHELIVHHGAYGATAFTGGRFTLWKKKLGSASFPIALENQGWRRPDWNKPPMAHVQGELYAIETAQLIELDKHYQNTLEFERKRTLVTIPHRKLYQIIGPQTPLQERIEGSLGIPPTATVTAEPFVHVVKCWMYIGNPAYWSDQLEQYFATVRLMKPNKLGWLGDYYSFTPQEYK